MIPIKPTREDATATDRPEEMYEGDAPATGKPPLATGESGRAEQGDAADSRRHPPHPTENAEGASVQGDESASGDVPVLPANAQGTDTVSSDEHAQPIEEESMYDARRDEDKDRPPSTRTDA